MDGTISPASGTYTSGDPVALTATPDTGWVFDRWEGGASGTVNPVTVTIPIASQVTAVFLELHTVTVDFSGQGDLDVYDGVDLLIPDANGDYVVPSGTELTLHPVETDADWAFYCWVDVLSGNDTPATLTVTQDESLLVGFLERTSLTTHVSGGGVVALDPVQPAEGYPIGTVVTVTAIPDPDWVFKKWTGSVWWPTSVETYVIIDSGSTHHITAAFVERVGIADIDLVDALGRSLNSIGHLGYPGEVWDSLYDRGDTLYVDGEMVPVGNGIPDVAEFYLLNTLFWVASTNYTYRGGVNSGTVWRYFEHNLAQAEVDMPDMPYFFQQMVAAYMTLGTYGMSKQVEELMEFFQLPFDPDPYTNLAGSEFRADADLDGDGVSNLDEYWWSVAHNQSGGAGAKSMGGCGAFRTLAAAMLRAPVQDADCPNGPMACPPTRPEECPEPDPRLTCPDGSFARNGQCPPEAGAVEPDPCEVTSCTEGEVGASEGGAIPPGKPEDLPDDEPLLPSSTPCPNAGCIGKVSVTMRSDVINLPDLDIDISIKAEFSGPEGCGPVGEWELDTPYQICLGRTVRVGVEGDEGWFKEWDAEGTLIDGSGDRIETFVVSGATEVWIEAWGAGNFDLIKTSGSVSATLVTDDGFGMLGLVLSEAPTEWKYEGPIGGVAEVTVSYDG